MRINISFWNYKDEDDDEYDDSDQIEFTTDRGELFSVEIAKKFDLSISKIRNGVCLAIWSIDKNKGTYYKNERKFSEV